MLKGYVKWFNSEKGYGFIKENPEGPDIFVHYSQIQQDGFKVLEEGQDVFFELANTDKGLQAHNVSTSEEK